MSMAIRGFLGRFGNDIGILGGEPDGLTVRPGAETVNPNFLALPDDGSVLYAAVRDDDAGNQIGAWAVEGGELRPLGTQPSGGDSVCHLTVDRTGRYVVSTHYGHDGVGSVAVHPIAADGGVEERSDLVEHRGSGPHQRQAGPHAHMVVNDPTGDYLLVVDLGADAVVRYQLKDGKLTMAGEAALPPGAGPRHLAVHPTLPYAYVANELDSTASVLDLDAFAVVSTIPTVGADTEEPSQPSAIRVSDDGRFCYIANRQVNTIAVFAISSDGAALELLTNVPCRGDHPRDLVLHDEYLYVANQHSDAVIHFFVDRTSGIPEAVGSALITPQPTALLFLDDGA